MTSSVPYKSVGVGNDAARFLDVFSATRTRVFGSNSERLRHGATGIGVLVTDGTVSTTLGEDLLALIQEIATWQSIGWKADFLSPTIYISVKNFSFITIVGAVSIV